MNNEYTIVLGSPLLRSGLSISTTVSAKYVVDAAVKALTIVREFNDRLDELAELADEERGRAHLAAVETTLGRVPDIGDMIEDIEKRKKAEQIISAIEARQRVRHQGNDYDMVFEGDELFECWLIDADGLPVVNIGPDAGEHILADGAVPRAITVDAALATSEPTRWKVKNIDYDGSFGSHSSFEVEHAVIESFLGDHGLPKTVIGDMIMTDELVATADGSLFATDAGVRCVQRWLRSSSESDEMPT